MVVAFREGLLLRLFDSADAFDDFNGKYHGLEYYSPQPTAELDTTKPIKSALSFSVSDDGLRWSYTIRGNLRTCSPCPGRATSTSSSSRAAARGS